MRISGHAKQLDIENEGCIGWDDSREALITVGKVSRNDELALATDLHPRNAFVPALDYHPDAEGELERATSDRAVELRSIFEDTSVVDGDILALCGGWSISDGDVFVLKTTGSCNHEGLFPAQGVSIENPVRCVQVTAKAWPASIEG